ncbi:MAG: hypothetical protein EOP09_10810, partial [Proteobacteria bacterium]
METDSGRSRTDLRPAGMEIIMLVITLGDPYSVSIECLLRLEKSWSQSPSGPTILVGAYEQWLQQSKELGGGAFALKRINDWTEAQSAGLYFLDIGSGKYKGPPKDLSVLDRGMVAKLSLEALRTLKNVSKLAVVTAPIDKFVCAQAGFTFPGQTEFFCDLWQDKGIMI